MCVCAYAHIIHGLYIHLIIQNKLMRNEWRTRGTASERKNSQIGQLFMYLLGAQLKRLKVSRRLKHESTPMLGLYMENFEVYIIS